MKALVIPTNRPDHARKFFDTWGDRGGWNEVIVVEDNETQTFSLPLGGHYIHYAWDSIAAELGDAAWIVSKRDSAIRCFGFWVAAKMGATSILTLDDDCLPLPGSDYKDWGTLFDQHLEAMGPLPKWTESVHLTRTRGLPYKNLGKLATVMANMGFWTGVPDYDAIQSLHYGGIEKFDFMPDPGNRIIPAGQYFPMCAMNLAFHRESAPLFYFPLMGEGQPYRRFDDIWAGIIAKKVMDHLGWQFSVGEPFVHHSRASDPFVNLVKEAPGIAANEQFWEMIDRIELGVTSSPIECMKRVGVSLQEADWSTENELTQYLTGLGKAIMAWCKLWENL